MRLGPLVDQMAEIDGPSLRRVGTQIHRIDANWKLMVDAFLEVYHVRTVHPDNAALLYDDQSVDRARCCPTGTAGSPSPKYETMIPTSSLRHPTATTRRSATSGARPSTSFGIFPNVVAPMDTGAFAFLCCLAGRRRAPPSWSCAGGRPTGTTGELPDEHTMRMALFETVMAQDTANMAPIQASIESPGAQPFQIGWHERLIHHFHRAVDLAIGEDRRPRRHWRCPTRSTAMSA